jgi:WD40 repeat protein
MKGDAFMVWPLPRNIAASISVPPGREIVHCEGSIMTNSTKFLAAGLLALVLGEYPPIHAAEKPALDVHGDPLPAGAAARFGSLRWRLPDAIEAVAVSPNGKYVGAVNMEGKVAVWEKENGRLLHEFSGSKTGEASLAFSPDGQYLATGGRFDNQTGTGDFRVRVWELKTGKLKAQFPAQKGSIGELVFSSDGAILLSAGFNQPVIAWKFPGGEKLREFPTTEYTSHNVALSPNGQLLAVSADDLKTVNVFSFDGSRRLHQFQSKGSFFHSCEFSPDSKSLLTHEHEELCFFDMATGKALSTISLEHDIFRQARLSPDGKKIALFHLDNDIHWLDAATGKPLDSWKGSSGQVDALAFSRDGKTIISGAWGVVHVWDASTAKVVQQPSGPSQVCYSLIFSAEGKTLLAASHDCFYFLDGQTLQERSRFPVAMFRHEYPEYRYSVVLSPDGNRAAFLGAKDEIVMVDSRQPGAKRIFRRPDWLPASLAFSPDGEHLYAVGHKAPGLRVWNVQTGKEDPPLEQDLVPLTNLSVARKAGKLAVVARGGQAHCRIWDLRTGKEEPGPKWDKKDSPDKILLSPDGKLLAAQWFNSHITVWDVTKKVELHRFDFGFDGPSDWTFSDDGKLLVTGHDHGIFRTWNMADGKKVAEVHGHPSDGVTLACSPDGMGLVSSCTSCTILRWQKSAWQGK